MIPAKLDATGQFEESIINSGNLAGLSSSEMLPLDRPLNIMVNHYAMSNGECFNNLASQIGFIFQFFFIVRSYLIYCAKSTLLLCLRK